MREGEIVTLIGANGAGKSTTLRSINGLNHARKGTIVFRGEDITAKPAHEIVKLGIAQSPEGRQLFPRMTVLENLEMGAFQRTDKSEFKDDIERVFTLFPRLAERRTQKAGTLSGGEQQMCAIGRALMARPTLLLLDEPSMGLAPILVERIFEIDRRDQQAGHDDPARRAERADGARGREPRLRARDREGRARGRREGAARRTSRSARPTSARPEPGEPRFPWWTPPLVRVALRCCATARARSRLRARERCPRSGDLGGFAVLRDSWWASPIPSSWFASRLTRPSGSVSLRLLSLEARCAKGRRLELAEPL